MFKLHAPEDDGLAIAEAGPWSANKHYFLRRYIDAFTTAMKGKRWAGLHYVDLFAGAGVERIEKSGKLEWGSPLIAAQAPHRFTQLHLCELQQDKFDAMKSRLAHYRQPSPPQLVCADANKAIEQIVAAIPPRTLSLAFLDPYGLHLEFATLAKLAQRRADLIIFFPDHLDALRNWPLYLRQARSNLDRVLGSAWRQAMLSTPSDKHPEVLTGLYVERIRTLGYTEFEYEQISLPNRRFLYRLIFCSCHKAGGNIWRGISSKTADGQTQFDFGQE